ncbi:PaaI family thioesterase [Pseudomonas sp. H9]|uniref:PaaI family thioesterase n=1 Tax=Pseudomonas sp. H9 TaxID=483968 RepID=UPI00105791DF|nr:PaaI family thioesterase [Pseudomonas sp. H9]TDF80817.1 PaaI family thioesterase [Pseudomonas sp. H9]
MDRDNPFWRMVEGKDPLPNAAYLLGWSFIDYIPKHRQIEVSFNALATFTNPLGGIQGGMMTAMLDDTMGPTVYANLEKNQGAVTVKLSTFYKRAAKPGHITGIGRLVKCGPKYWYTAGMLKDSDDNILATATATFKIIRL